MRQPPVQIHSRWRSSIWATQHLLFTFLSFRSLFNYPSEQEHQLQLGISDMIHHIHTYEYKVHPCSMILTWWICSLTDGIASYRCGTLTLYDDLAYIFQCSRNSYVRLYKQYFYSYTVSRLRFEYSELRYIYLAVVLEYFLTRKVHAQAL